MGAVQAAHQDEGAHPRKDADGDFARAKVAAIFVGRHAAADSSNFAADSSTYRRSNRDPPSSSKLAHADSHRDARTLPAGGTRQHAT